MDHASSESSTRSASSFFSWIEHPDLGRVPTYGGPFDSYAIPTPDVAGATGPQRQDIEYIRYRYDHDVGGWTECEIVDFRVVTEELLIDLGAWPE